jgi:hypothetical protein
VLQVRKGLERRFDRALGRAVDAEHQAQVDDFEGVQAEVAEVVMHGVRQLLGREGRVPRSVLAASGTDLGDDYQTFGIGMQSLADQLIGDVGAIEVARVDVINAARHGLTQYGERAFAIVRRSEDAGSGELHRTVTHALHRMSAKLENVSFPDIGHGPSP